MRVRGLVTAPWLVGPFGVLNAAPSQVVSKGGIRTADYTLVADKGVSTSTTLE